MVSWVVMSGKKRTRQIEADKRRVYRSALGLVGRHT